MREAVRVREKESNVGGMRIQNKDGKKEFGSKYGIHQGRLEFIGT